MSEFAKPRRGEVCCKEVGSDSEGPILCHRLATMVWTPDGERIPFCKQHAPDEPDACPACGAETQITVDTGRCSMDDMAVPVTLFQCGSQKMSGVPLVRSRECYQNEIHTLRRFRMEVRAADKLATCSATAEAIRQILVDYDEAAR